MKKYLKPEMEVSKFAIEDSILLESGGIPTIGPGIQDGFLSAAPVNEGGTEVADLIGG